MSDPPDPPDSSNAFLAHPSTVEFEGLSGGLLGFSVSPGAAGIQEVTSHSSTVTGGRVVKDYVCTSIDSGTATVRILGNPGFSRNDVGSEGTLAITTPAGNLSVRAILRSFDLDVEVGALIRGTAEFTLIGD
jgi:hypothetical protein